MVDTLRWGWNQSSIAWPATLSETNWRAIGSLGDYKVDQYNFPTIVCSWKKRNDWAYRTESEHCSYKALLYLPGLGTSHGKSLQTEGTKCEFRCAIGQKRSPRGNCASARKFKKKGDRSWERRGEKEIDYTSKKESRDGPRVTSTLHAAERVRPLRKG